MRLKTQAVHVTKHTEMSPVKVYLAAVTTVYAVMLQQHAARITKIHCLV